MTDEHVGLKPWTRDGYLSSSEPCEHNEGESALETRCDAALELKLTSAGS